MTPHQSTRKKRRSRSKSVVRSRKRRIKSQTDPQTAHPYKTTPATTFEDYLGTENFLPQDEHDRFLRCLRSPLPTSFRVRFDHVNDEFKKLVHRGEADAYPIPGIQGGWQLYGESPYIRQWLTRKTIAGQVSRQEFVSMIPVLLLQVEPQHRVLDLCASPGSKTTQAVDDMYTSNASPSGFCIANELDPKRAYILAHRCSKTLGARQRSLAICCHNAAKFPNVEAGLKRSCSSLRPYDRIICDVPCSGDGTLRKDIKAWKAWHPSFGISLHPLQVRIAKRGIALLKIGGIMTYSTCSFHPVENEAVVAALLETGCVELIAPKLEGIVFRPGLAHWKVFDDDCQEVTQEESRNWPDSLWPPRDKPTAEALSRCVRMVPHDNDTGGFFIAILKKVREFSVRDSTCLKRKSPLVTPKASHHVLYPTSSESRSNTEHIQEQDRVKFKRSPRARRLFHLSASLAEHLVDRPGSHKLNLVYAGQAGELVL
jgi:tRNA (cytosine34-C5)-methyltransferase